MSSSTNNIIFGSLLTSEFAQTLSSYEDERIIILVDENTEKFCLDFLLTNFDSLKNAEIVVIPSGEENKILEICLQVWETLAEYKIGRKDLLINLGGGVITDMGGFIASVYKRGIDFIHLPTTLLAMVDAAIGGKNGVDLGLNKNFLGVFRQPNKIFIDPNFLDTLSDQHLIDGMAEMLKHALIASPEQWEKLTEIRNLNALKELELIRASTAIKIAIVNEDPTECGIRKLLNFGHTVGHAIEGYLLNKSDFSHGRAVGAGMIVECFLSYRMGLLSKEDFSCIKNVLLRWYEVPLFDAPAIEKIIDLMYNDKKNFSNKIHFTLLKSIGNAVYDVALDKEEVFPILNEIIIKHD